MTIIGRPCNKIGSRSLVNWLTLIFLDTFEIKKVFTILQFIFKRGRRNPRIFSYLDTKQQYTNSSFFTFLTTVAD